MTRVDSRTGVELISRDECLRLLAGEVVGRVGIIEGSAPLVLPVNYGLHGEEVIFRTGPGSKLDASRHSPACFEVDAFDRASRSGWSVVVRGRLEEVTAFDRTLLAEVEALAEPWLDIERSNVVRLVSTSISGRRVPPAGPTVPAPR